MNIPETWKNSGEGCTLNAETVKSNVYLAGFPVYQ